MFFIIETSFDIWLLNSGTRVSTAFMAPDPEQVRITGDPSTRYVDKILLISPVR